MKRILAALVVGSVLSSCGGGASNPSTPTAPATSPAAVTSTYQGTVAGSAGQKGTLTVTVTVQALVARSSASVFEWPFVATLYAQATTVAATASLHIAGANTIFLTGTFDPSTKVLNLSGGGFTFTGTLAGTVVSGTYTGPGGVTGGFSGQSTAGGTVTAYCGTYVGDGGVDGVLNFQVSATGAVSGVSSGTAQGQTQVRFLTGQVSGTTITFSTVDDRGTGTIQNGTASGTGGAGTPWSASTAACQ